MAEQPKGAVFLFFWQSQGGFKPKNQYGVLIRDLK
jgi:hypothetical protein